METRTVSEEMRALGRSVIDTEDELAALRESEVLIEYLVSDREKTRHGREVFGECERVPDKYRWAIPYDFTVTIFSPNVGHLNEQQMRVLMLHELMHVGVEKDGNAETYRIVSHDVEDFRAILDRFGMGWA